MFSHPFSGKESGNMMLGSMLVSGVVLLGLGALHQKNVLFKASASASKAETILDKSAKVALETIMVFNHNYRTSEGMRWLQISDDSQHLFLAGPVSEIPKFMDGKIAISGESRITSFNFSYCDFSKMEAIDNQVFGFSAVRPDSQFDCGSQRISVTVRLRRANVSDGSAVLEATATSERSKKISAKYTFPKNEPNINGSNVVKALSGMIDYDGKVMFCVDYTRGEIEMNVFESSRDDENFVATFDVELNSGTVRVQETRMVDDGLMRRTLPGDWQFVKGASPYLDTAYDCDNGDEFHYNRRMPEYNKVVNGTKTCFELDDSHGSNHGRACHKFYWHLQVYK